MFEYPKYPCMCCTHYQEMLACTNCSAFKKWEQSLCEIESKYGREIMQLVELIAKNEAEAQMHTNFANQQKQVVAEMLRKRCNNK